MRNIKQEIKDKGCKGDKLEQARAMKCLGRLIENVELDPDPNTQDELQEEYNCINCESYSYCATLLDTLVRY